MSGDPGLGECHTRGMFVDKPNKSLLEVALLVEVTVPERASCAMANKRSYVFGPRTHVDVSDGINVLAGIFEEL